MRTWGRLGSESNSRATAFPDRERAMSAVERLVRLRLQRRYELVTWR